MLLERDIELRSAERFLADVRNGTGSVLVLEGAPGIGKTALLSAVGERAADQGIQVLQARASQLDRDFPLALHASYWSGVCEWPQSPNAERC